MSFKLFLDQDGKPQFDETGTPLFIQDGADKPAAIDVNALHDQVRKIGGEAAAHRREKEDAIAKLGAYQGVDPGAGRIVEALTRELETERAGKNDMIRDLLVQNAFAASAYLRDNTVLPPEFACAALAGHFSVRIEDGKPTLVAKDENNNLITRPDDPARPASPEEAIRILVERHPRRDALLKAPAPKGGSGAVHARPGPAGSAGLLYRPVISGASGASGVSGVSGVSGAYSSEAKAAFIREHGLAAFKQLPRE